MSEPWLFEGDVEAFADERLREATGQAAHILAALLLQRAQRRGAYVETMSSTIPLPGPMLVVLTATVELESRPAELAIWRQNCAAVVAHLDGGEE